jgi:hypothetical protein
MNEWDRQLAERQAKPKSDWGEAAKEGWPGKSLDRTAKATKKSQQCFNKPVLYSPSKVPVPTASIAYPIQYSRQGKGRSLPSSGIELHACTKPSRAILPALAIDSG